MPNPCAGADPAETAGPAGPSGAEGLKKKSGWLKRIGDYLNGFFLYGLIQPVYEKRRGLDMLFMTSLFARTIGFPHLFNYYHLRLLPFYVKLLGPWKRRVLRERDVFDRMGE